MNLKIEVTFDICLEPKSDRAGFREIHVRRRVARSEMSGCTGVGFYDCFRREPAALIGGVIDCGRDGVVGSIVFSDGPFVFEVGNDTQLCGGSRS